MTLARSPRSPALAPFVESLWVHRELIGHRFERILPTNRMQLLVNLAEDQLCDYSAPNFVANRVGGIGLQGLRTTATLVDTADQRAVCGVTFTPGGGAPFFRLAAVEVCERVVDLGDLWGSDASRLRERLQETDEASAQLDILEAALLDRIRVDRRDRAVAAACGLLSQGLSVRVVTERLGMTPHQLIDSFTARVGLRPKAFARVARFQNALSVLRERCSWAGLAGRCGFSDQAHFIREFRLFAGVTPTQYRPRSARDRNHCPVEDGQFSSIPSF